MKVASALKAFANGAAGVVVGAAVLLSACMVPPLPAASPRPPPTQPALPALPEGRVASTQQRLVHAQRHIAATGHALASDAALLMLREGGSALDAAIAAQMVLTLVEPQSSGIGGGALLMHWDGRALQAWDGRETAPAQATENLLLGPDGNPQPFLRAAVGGLAVGVPGTVRVLEAAHRVHGRLPWARLFTPAIALSQQGFPVSERLHAQLRADASLRQDPQSRAYFYGADGEPLPVGHLLRNPALAAVLQRLASQGSAGLHTGPVAEDMVRRVRSHPTNPGPMQLADLAAYAPKLREPLCGLWQQHWWVCGFPPPSSGQMAILQMLGILERLPSASADASTVASTVASADASADASSAASTFKDGLPTADWLHRYTEAARLAYADRALYLADPDFVPPPVGRWHSLLGGNYLQERAALVGPLSMKRATAGKPKEDRQFKSSLQPNWAPQTEGVEYGTSHISIVDSQGRAVSMTTTIEALFGARLMADGGTGLPGGYLLNNQLTDFSAAPRDAEGRPIANRVEPGKRPRSSMSPTLVFDGQRGPLVLNLGSPLGQAIPHLVAKSLIASLQWNLDPLAAISLPNFGSFNGPTLLETGRYPASIKAALLAKGHELQDNELASGLQVLRRTPGGWVGASDPRREGAVRAD